MIAKYFAICLLSCNFIITLQITCIDNLGKVLGIKKDTETCETSGYCLHVFFDGQAKIVTANVNQIITGEVRTCANSQENSYLQYCSQGKTGCFTQRHVRTWLGPYEYAEPLTGEFTTTTVCCCNGSMCNKKKVTRCHNTQDMTFITSNGRPVRMDANYTCAGYDDYCFKMNIRGLAILTVQGSDKQIALKGRGTGCPENGYMEICKTMNIIDTGVKYCKPVKEIKSADSDGNTLAGNIEICCCRGDYCVGL